MLIPFCVSHNSFNQQWKIGIFWKIGKIGILWTQKWCTLFSARRLRFSLCVCYFPLPQHFENTNGVSAPRGVGFSRVLCTECAGLILWGVECFPGSDELSEIPVTYMPRQGRHWPQFPWHPPGNPLCSMHQPRHQESPLWRLSINKLITLVKRQGEFWANTGCCEVNSAKILKHLSALLLKSVAAWQWVLMCRPSGAMGSLEPSWILEVTPLSSAPEPGAKPTPME